MHEEAILNSAHSVLGPLGKVITIGDVKAVFNSTTAANANESYRCADGKCGVALTAVIIVPKKIDRKTSPASHFRAPSGHKSGCVRVASPTSQTPVQPANGSLPASPASFGFPVVWVDSLAASGNAKTHGANPALNTPVGPGSPGSTRQRGTAGTGTSKSRSKVLSMFAAAWKGMNAATQKNTLLQAPWNTGGTYYSAFNNLSYAKHDVLTLGTKIHVGTISSVTDTGTVYKILLAEKNGLNGEALILEVMKADLIAAAGAQLNTALALLSATPPATAMFAYVLGAFSGSGKTLRLQVPHPHYLHMVS